MKSPAAAALLLCVHADETSLMQGLMERHNKLSTGSVSSKDGRRDATANLMETATNMIKNGVTPDVVTFVESTINEIDLNILTPITDEHHRDQNLIDSYLADLQAASDEIEDHSYYVQQATDRATLSLEHKQCRKQEAVLCARSRKCETELRVKWEHVKTAEARMRELHYEIHTRWCIDDQSVYHPDTSCTWDWHDSTHWEGDETSQSVHEYCIADLTSDIIEFRGWVDTKFAAYKAQKVIVETKWTEYNAKLLLCAQAEETLELWIPQCDEKQRELNEQVCADANENNAHRQRFGDQWEHILQNYLISVGECSIGYTAEDGHLTDERCDIRIRSEAEAGCRCSGIKQLEYDRKREWETLKIVTCLLETVYTHVIDAIASGTPCPTETSDPDGTTEAINHCHVVEDALTANLTIYYCKGRSNSDNLVDCLPEEPPLPPVVEPPCTAAYIWEEQGFFPPTLLADLNGDLDRDSLRMAMGLTGEESLHTYASDAGWAACAAPKACVHCQGTAPLADDYNYLSLGTECRAHERYLAPGQTNGQTFRCLTAREGFGHGECISAAGRCNQQDNCADSSDEEYCDTLWDVPAILDQASTECRDGLGDPILVAMGSSDVQFKCQDNTCIPVEGRCNGYNNCADGSDESGCSSNVITLEATSGRTATDESFSTSSVVYHDRNYAFDSDIGDFEGKTFIKTFNDDKLTPATHVQTKVRLSRPSTVTVVKLPGHSLEWLSEVGRHGEVWTQVSSAGLTYRGGRHTKHTDWILGAPDPLVHQDWAPDGSRDSAHHDGALGEDVYVAGDVYQRTFPAGVVSMQGNSGGDGSYLMFTANPVPPVAPISFAGRWSGGNFYGGAVIILGDECLVENPSTVEWQTATYRCENNGGNWDFIETRTTGATHAHRMVLQDDGTLYVTKPGHAWTLHQLHFTHALSDSKCPHEHDDRLFRTEGHTLEECYAECLATNGCRHFSQGIYNGGHVCMGCTTLTNAQTHVGFEAYDMA